VEPAISFPSELPISERRDDLVAAIRAHQVLVVAGATGSGKSTQLPKLCLEAGRGSTDTTHGRGGWIGHTQPRRIAARSIAERVAEELGSQVGRTVGYKVRFDDEVGEDTRIKVMTDGILLAEIQRDRQLEKYDTIIVDEAHERSLNIDFLLGYLRQLLPRRPDLKLIITSATIDTARFSEHFDDAPVIEVEGRTFPVEVRYRPLDDPSGEQGPLDQVEGICAAVQELRRETDGDVLVFCAGEREIRDAAAALEELQLPDTEVFPLFARLSSAEQHRVFERHSGRRIVLATNVAETSLTVPGIRSVIDPGTARISRYSHRTKVQRLPIEAISQASADQRSGRCGRVGPGIAIRLYSEDDLAGRPEFTEPEIRRTNLASVILQMANLGLGDVASFPFVDPPDARNIRDGIALLEELGAVDPERHGTRRWLTPIGRRLVRLPVDPRLGRMVLEAGENGCLHEVLVITAAMSIQDPRERPFDERARADQLHARFDHPDSDFLTYVNLWNHLRGQRRERSGNQFRKMCRDELLNHNRIREWQDVHDQLRRAAKQLGFTPNTTEAEPELIHLSLLSGLLSHVGMKDTPAQKGRGARGRDGGNRGKDRRTQAEFVGARQARFAIARGSVLARNPPNWVMVGELVETNRLWARTVTRIDPDWVERVGAHLARYSYGEPWWDRERGAAMTTERVTVYGLPVVSGRRVPVAGVDPQVARELFIHHALVEGDWGAHHAFMDRNAAVAEDAERLGARARRSDLIVERRAIFDVYDRRLPDDVTTGPEFDRWWKAERRLDPTLLDLSIDDLLSEDADGAVDPDAFPEVWRVAEHELPVSYEFDPTSDDDGATITIDAGIVGQLDPTAFDWNVPGFRDELIDALIRTLPKQLRKLFVPVPDTVALISPHVTPDGGSVVEGVRRELNRMLDAPLPVDAFDLEALPKHLRPTFRIVGTDGRELASGKDLRVLAEQVRAESAAIAATVDTGLEQRGLRSWSFGELPRTVERQVDGRLLTAYPALADDGDSAAIVACTRAAEQATTMWAGTRRLVRLAMPAPARQLDRLLDQDTRAAMARSTVQSKVDWYNDVIGCALDHLIAGAGGPAWDAAAFDRLVEAVRDGFHDTLGQVAASAAGLIARHTAIRRRSDELVAAPLVPAIADVRQHLDRLVYRGVLTGVGFSRLDDVDRYLRAIERRLAVLPDRPQRDAELMARCRGVEAEYDDLAATVSPSAELESLAWALEELRVSSFAQQLRTPAPVSEQRIRKEIQRIARGM
jgi:ATP-dependent helicase HrpA